MRLTKPPTNSRARSVPVLTAEVTGDAGLLGSEKPAEQGHTRAARAANRRVEVRLFSADQALAGIGSPGSGAMGMQGTQGTTTTTQQTTPQQ